MYISWFICGLIAAIINYKKYRTKIDIKNKYFGKEFFLFIWGYIGLFLILYIYLWSKIHKK